MTPLLPNSIPISSLPALYDVDRSVHNLENGFWHPMPRSVADAYAAHNTLINSQTSLWARDTLPGTPGLTAAYQQASAAVARMVGASPAEIAITRSGSDSLQLLITNYKPLRPGDAVLHCDLDYDSAIAALGWLGTYRGAHVVPFTLPQPATTANILQAYHDALTRTPHARLLLLTQVSHRTGLITPVREIVAMARARGVDTVVDLAHGVGCLDFQLPDLDCDFAGWSLHKWTSAPLGTGALYIRAHRLPDIGLAFDNSEASPTLITSRVPAGTVNFPALLTIPAAVDFHFAIGARAKQDHLRSLRNRWVHQVRDLSNVELCVPDDPARSCAITSFRLRGMHTPAQALHLQQLLLTRYQVLTVWRPGPAGAPVLRVTPGLPSTPQDSDSLAQALQQEHALFT